METFWYLFPNSDCMLDEFPPVPVAEAWDDFCGNEPFVLGMRVKVAKAVFARNNSHLQNHNYYFCSSNKENELIGS